MLQTSLKLQSREKLGPAHLVAGGGVAARALNKNRKVKAPTSIHIEGILADSDGRAINLIDWALPELTREPQSNPIVFAIAGTTMDAGKSTSAAYLINGLAKAGLKVGAAKVTGTGAGGDMWLMHDAGARHVVDFTDAGYASTYKLPEHKLTAIFERLTAHLASKDLDVVVIEVADGLFQAETSALLQTQIFQESVHGMLFAAGDAMGAVHGLDWLRQLDLPVFGVCGLLTSAPLAAREARQHTHLPSISLKKLSDPAWARALYEQYSLSVAASMPAAEAGKRG
jgi:dethiobiotin synthetase